MKKIFIKLGGLDKRIVYIIIALSVLLPLLKPDLFKLPIPISPESQQVFDEIETLAKKNKDGETAKILVAFAYGASTKPEIHPMVIALLNQLFVNDIKVYIMSLFAEGVQMSIDAMNEVKDSDLFELTEYTDYVMFDYRVGGEIVIKNLVSDFKEVYKKDIKGKSIDDIPMMNNIENIESFDFVFDFSAGVPGNAEWVQYACDPTGVPLSSGCTSIMVTDVIPYVKSGQIKGILAGMPGAAEYEALVKLSGKATDLMAAQSIAHIVIVLFIIFGNIAYYIQRKEGGGN